MASVIERPGNEKYQASIDRSGVIETFAHAKPCDTAPRRRVACLLVTANYSVS